MTWSIVGFMVRVAIKHLFYGFPQTGRGSKISVTVMRLRPLCILLALAFAAGAQKYTGPRPPKADLPYLKHASNLIPLEETEAKEEKGKKEDITYVIDGVESSARTPLASPIFLLESQKLAPDTLELYRLESRNGRRELTVSPKKPGKPIRMVVTRLASDGLYKLEVEDSLDPGQYSLSPTGSNQVFCFAVF